MRFLQTLQPQELGFITTCTLRLERNATAIGSKSLTLIKMIISVWSLFMISNDLTVKINANWRLNRIQIQFVFNIFFLLSACNINKFNSGPSFLAYFYNNNYYHYNNNKKEKKKKRTKIVE